MDRTDLLVASFCAWAVLALCNALLGFITSLSLLRDAPEISADRHLLLFKRFVALNMYQALFQYAALLGAFVTSLISRYADGWTLPQAALGMTPAFATLFLAVFLMPLKSRIRSMPVAEEYQAEFDRVVSVWMTKPFPDWK